jgi:hypothetical protein
LGESPAQEVVPAAFQHLAQAIKDLHSGIGLTGFYSLELAPVDLRIQRQFFLGQTSRQPQAVEVSSEDLALSERHAIALL